MECLQEEGPVGAAAAAAAEDFSQGRLGCVHKAVRLCSVNPGMLHG